MLFEDFGVTGINFVISGWEYDAASGYYYNLSKGYHYDPKSGLFYSSELGISARTYTCLSCLI